MNDPVEQIDVAAELLEQALHLYFERSAFFATIHLAAAAEELLGKYVSASGKPSALQQWAGLMAAVSDDHSVQARKSDWNCLSHSKNAVKHVDFPEEETLLFDAQSEAKEWLSRAVTNYVQLQGSHGLPDSALIHRFRMEEEIRRRAAP